jgi:formylglycine-generating enzyme required for sulfatase activity
MQYQVFSVAVGGGPDAAEELNRFLRDHRTVSSSSSGQSWSKLPHSKRCAWSNRSEPRGACRGMGFDE